MKNIWILTEERPKTEVLECILRKFCSDEGFASFIDNLRIIPLIKDGKFSFCYELKGFDCNRVDKIFIKNVSGNSIFVYFLIFYQEKEPNSKDCPLYIIEETKTDDKESRNTGVFQRCSKFVFAGYYYPEAKQIMLYNIKVGQKINPTETYIFGTRLLLAMGVEILGKNLDEDIFQPFRSIDEVILYKSGMRKAPKGNIPITINKVGNEIQVSGRLFKSGGLSHDPNIGALSLISFVLRKLGWNGNITIINHGLEQVHIGKTNKFLQIAGKLNVSLSGLKMPKVLMNENYWRYEYSGEKLATIFIHLVVESFTRGESIFENHAGCEKGYFITSDGSNIPLAKYKDKGKYKLGDKSQKIEIPDLILLDLERNTIINIEGKKIENLNKGLKELELYDFIEKEYVKKYYSGYKIVRTLVLYGGKEKAVHEVKVGFLLNEEGYLVLGIQAPELFKDAIKNLLDYWK
jgi:hypothetical protein